MKTSKKSGSTQRGGFIGHKVLLLIVFMVRLTFIILIWFVSRINHHATHFKASLTHDKETLEAEQLKEQTTDHLHKMEEGLLKQRQDSEAFNENFLQQQTQLFDKIDSFLGGKKNPSKTQPVSKK